MITAIIQARTSSSRLPEKVLKDLPYGSGISALAQVIRRVKRSKFIDEVVVATTHDDKDEAIIKIADQEEVASHKGSLDDVLERFYEAAENSGAETVVRITSDCPCIDPEIIDQVIARHVEVKADYASNAVKRSYPDGFDVEVFTFDALEKAYHNADKDFEREHVTPYIHGSPDNFRIEHVEAPKALTAPLRRLTLDTMEDYIVLCLVFDYLYGKNPIFSAGDIMKLFEEKPWLDLINGHIAAKKPCLTLNDEIREMIRISEFQGYQRVRGFLEECLDGKVTAS